MKGSGWGQTPEKRVFSRVLRFLGGRSAAILALSPGRDTEGPGRYLETCRRYVYLNPVRAGLVKHAADYPWCWIAPSDEPSAGSVPDGPVIREWRHGGQIRAQTQLWRKGAADAA